MKNIIKIGTRNSPLALCQAKMVQAAIRAAVPQIITEIVPMTTTGDRILDRTLDKVGGKGLFVKELDRALLDGEIDIAVHSLKDVPMENAPGIVTAAYLERGNPKDVLVVRAKDVPVKVIGTSSARRACQLERLYPDARIVPVRGNLQTRLGKMERGDMDALVLAAAGLERMGEGSRISRYFSVDDMIPAAGQGVVVVQMRSRDIDQEQFSFLRRIDCRESRVAAETERAFTSELGGGCHAAVGAYARLENDCFVLDGFYQDEASGELRGGSVRLPAGRMIPADDAQMHAICSEGIELGRRLARRLSERMSGGYVWIAGAGPGSVELLTKKARRLMESVDVIAYDALVSEEILAKAGRHIRMISVGKRAGAHSVPQDDINRLLVESAQAGYRVLRLKGGDPFLFGRGAEEMEQLRAAGVQCEVIPGVPSAIAALSYAGIPVTHRDYASSVHMITGQNRHDKDGRIPYKALVQTGGTLVFLMGLGRLEEICAGLQKAGMDADTPAAVVSCGTTAFQNVVCAPLFELARSVRKQQIHAPAIICVGYVCACRENISWKERKPLHDRLYIVTRPEGKESDLADALRDRGAQVIELPSIERIPTFLQRHPDEVWKMIAERKKPGWLVFTSPAGVDLFFQALDRSGFDIRQLLSAQTELFFAVVGKATASRLRCHGISPDVMPRRYDSDALTDLLLEAAKGHHIFLMRAKKGTQYIPETLIRNGLEVTDIALYDTVRADMPSWLHRVKELIGKDRVDGVCFTSASTVESFAASMDIPERRGNDVPLPPEARHIRGYFIGEKTAGRAGQYGITGHTAAEATIEALVRCIEEDEKTCCDI